MADLSRLDTGIAGVLVIERAVSVDARGGFERLYCSRDLQELAGLRRPLAQVNLSRTRAEGTVRGLHFQYPPHAETKIVICLKGRVFDVAVDLRAKSATFLGWHGEVLAAGDRKGLLVPDGCAHGFQALTDDCELLYFHSAAYEPSAEGGIHPADPRIGIRWPLPVINLSPRDEGLQRVSGEFTGIAA